MRFNGRWFQCDDGVSRPVIRGEIQTANGDWEFLELLIDTGADRTVLSADVLGFLGLTPATSARQIGGLGGIAKSVTVSTLLRLTRDDGVKAAFRSDYVACTDRDALDMSILGRDILDLFALVADRHRMCWHSWLGSIATQFNNSSKLAVYDVIRHVAKTATISAVQ